MTRVEKTKKTTIYDLAELTGVSASAVSAILNGNWKSDASAQSWLRRSPVLRKSRDMPLIGRQVYCAVKIQRYWHDCAEI